MKKKKNDLQKKLVFTLFFLASFLCIEAQTSESKKDWIKDLKIGIRMQKAQKLYWENGFAIDFTSPKIANNRLHLGFSYVTTRLGSAMGTNAIKQDNFLFNLGYYFRHQKNYNLLFVQIQAIFMQIMNQLFLMFYLTQRHCYL